MQMFKEDGLVQDALERENLKSLKKIGMILVLIGQILKLLYFDQHGTILINFLIFKNGFIMLIINVF